MVPLASGLWWGHERVQAGPPPASTIRTSKIHGTWLLSPDLVKHCVSQRERRMAKPIPLPVWDRKAGKLVEEWMDDSKATYESRPHHSITQWLESQPIYDWLLAAYQHSGPSARKIEPFIRNYQIDMSEFEPVIYRSYAEFFVRRLRPEARKFPADPQKMGAFAEARYFAWEQLESEQSFPVKGHSLSAEHILVKAERARSFVGGPYGSGALGTGRLPPPALSRQWQDLGEGLGRPAALDRELACATKST